MSVQTVAGTFRRNTLYCLLALGFVLMAGLTAGVLFFSEGLLSGTVDRARNAFARGDLETALSLTDCHLARHSNDLDALCLKARSLIGLGRASEAYPLFARLGGDRLREDDLLAVGDALFKAKRDVMGLTAWRAASRLVASRRRNGFTDTNEGAVAKALASRRDSPLTIKDTEKLGAVTSVEALAELVVAVAASDDPARRNAKPPSDLTRLLGLDHRQLVAIDGVAAARKRMARMRLEDGQISEARAWLERIPVSQDPEVSWLFSRVWLAERNVSEAKAALTEAYDFGSDDRTAVEPAPYIGAKRCAACHAEVFANHQKTGHAETFATGTAMKNVPLPKGAVQDPGNPEVTHTFSRTAQDVELESNVEGKILRVVLDYALGSGRHGMTMLGREPSGHHRTLRLSYYSTGGEHWDLTSGFEKRPDSPESYLGTPLGDESLAKCLNCHTTRFTAEKERSGPEAADRGIGCERCHGPARNHLSAVELEFPDLAIGRPKSATPAQRLRLCGQCHGPDGNIPPSDPRFVRFQAANLPYSRCVTESGGKLDCVACHDPHSPLETDQRYYEVRCLVCHNGPMTAPASTSVPAKIRIEPVAAKPCPVNAKSGCVSCHMPKVKEVMPHTDFTDHHIRAHRGPSGERAANVKASP